MPALTMPTFGDHIDHDVQRAVKDIVAAINDLDARYTALQHQLTTRPTPYSLDQIRAALSSNGSHPLNLTGLIGAATTPAVVGP